MQHEHGPEAMAHGKGKQWRTLIRTNVGLLAHRGRLILDCPAAIVVLENNLENVLLKDDSDITGLFAQNNATKKAQMIYSLWVLVNS